MFNLHVVETIGVEQRFILWPRPGEGAFNRFKERLGHADPTGSGGCFAVDNSPSHASKDRSQRAELSQMQKCKHSHPPRRQGAAGAQWPFRGP